MLDLCEACDKLMEPTKVDEETTDILQQAATAASAKAVQDAWAAGLSITIMEEGQLVSIAPDGTKTILRMD